MKISILLLVFTALLLNGCKGEKPSEPEFQTPIYTRAIELYNSNTEVTEAAEELKRNYPVTADTILSALYKAGYTPENITTAVRIVFLKTPGNGMPLLREVLSDISVDKAAELIIGEYIDYLKLYREELISLTGQITDINKMIRIFRTSYGYDGSEVYALMSESDIAVLQIVSGLKTVFSMSEDELLVLMINNDEGINEITEVLKSVFNYSDDKTAGLLLFYNFNIQETAGAIKEIYNPGALRMASIFAPSLSVKEFINLLINCKYLLNDAGLVLKNYYLYDALTSCLLLKEMNFDLIHIGKMLRDVYGLGYYSIVLILKDAGYEVSDLILLLEGLAGLSQFEIISLLISIGIDYCDILAYWNIPC